MLLLVSIRERWRRSSNGWLLATATFKQIFDNSWIGCAHAVTGDTSHRRTPEIVANLALGIQYFLDFAIHFGAIPPQWRDRLWTRAWDALEAAASRQAPGVVEQEPARRFIELMTSALNGGKMHLTHRQGGRPQAPERWGGRTLMGRASNDLSASG